MENYQALIDEESKIMATLHRKVHETYKNRRHKISLWKKACTDFHSYESKIDSLIDRIYKEPKISDKEMQEFAITFLELDPMFFRSGYIKEEILRKIKRSILSQKQIERLLVVLQNAVEKKGTREYRRYCRLAAKIADKKFVEYLKNTSKYEEGAEKSRAKLMLSYLNE